MKPGEEGSFVGKENFGFDFDGYLTFFHEGSDCEAEATTEAWVWVEVSIDCFWTC